MAIFEPNVPVDTKEAFVDVTVDPNKPLSVGRHIFRLVVGDDSGNLSEANEVEVFVIDNQKPTAILDAPKQVPFGAGFSLSAKRSTDAGGGRVVLYTWTRVL
jgi:hypothetical protein